ncbi:hypothetical protein [Kurthia sibirica]|uniref:Uncharacterized protein n=1 Tax=Kurthia sibirica TaxID=202750 RepID=A0A2U3ANM5_9BACL|nr:hypothetical protein [Kurthia sibirica]PWI26099.1 hypothetical protein DEX24_04010 [Kurthia sibirica]GEK34937.1 hypothetical protein KSI01_24700 [Kurthia sibirica]
MKKKHGKLLTDKNMIMFPGTVERLLATGHDYAETSNYELAVEAFSEAMQYEVLDEHSMNVYVYSLYEMRRFQEARELCELLLARGPSRYIELMELYLSICMELRDFFHVQQIIQSLLEEEVIPPESLEKFKNILSLSEKLANLSIDDTPEKTEIKPDDYEVATFFNQPLFMQLTNLQRLTEINVRPLANQLKDIIEAEEVHPMVQSIALYMLVAQQVDLQVTVKKFDESRVVNTAEMLLPDDTPLFLEVFERITERLEKEGSLLEMAHFLLARHILVTYPFEWFQYSADDIVEGYTDYVHSLFEQNQVSNNELLDFIKTLEKYSDIPEV